MRKEYSIVKHTEREGCQPHIPGRREKREGKTRRRGGGRGGEGGKKGKEREAAVLV